MSYVDMMSNTRWSVPDHQNRKESVIRSSLSDTQEQELTRQLFRSVLDLNDPNYSPLDPGEKAAISAACGIFNAAKTAMDAAIVDSTLLNQCLDYEAAMPTLMQLPLREWYPVGEEWDSIFQSNYDYVVTENAARQIQRDTVTAQQTTAVLNLYAQRVAYRGY